ncbi:MAG: protein-glutamine gamma-glutamyltransferase [Gaiellaceae bacterium]|nr:protein-glutamine gamma-glutamyltransferase [Gaiellaceae bacterium]
MLKTVSLSGLAALVIAVDWLRFEEPRLGGERPVVLVALAIAPVLLRPLWLRLAGIVVAAVLAASVAFSLSPLAIWPGGRGFFGPIGSRFSRGFLDFYDFRLPINGVARPQMHAVLLTAIFGFTLAVALAIAARRALVAVLILFIGAGWPATLLSGGNELGRGIAILGVALAILAAMTARPSRLALVAAGAVIAGAFALSSSPAVAKSAFLDWQHWDFSTHAQKSVSVRYVWDAQYNGIHFPKKQTIVMTIRAPHRPFYWRATVLDRFDGTRWLERIWHESPAEARVLQPAASRARQNLIPQKVTIAALQDNHVIGASVPVTNDLGKGGAYAGQGVTLAIGGLHRDEHYTVSSYAPSPTPQELVRVRPDYPKALTRPGRELGIGDGVNALPFGRAGREKKLLDSLRGRLQPYAQLFRRAQAVAGETRSPYAATVALEAWFRSTGGFTYSEQPGTTPGLPPLVGFVTNTKTGYCQHFAGAMAVMLRLLGIPARVAAGFVPGRYQSDLWQVTDHDAHAWVEVWFKGYGWLPFDPTPGRGRISASYSSTSAGFNAQSAAKLLAAVVRGGEVFGRGATGDVLGHDPNRRNPRSTGDLPLGIGSAVTPEPKRRAPSLLVFLFLLACGVAVLIVVLKLARRKSRYLTRDPRRIAVACARELAEFLQDQRVVTASATTFQELSGMVGSRMGVDAARFGRAATAARYGPPNEAGVAATRAREELRGLKRRLRRSLTRFERARGLLSVRSLGLG